jgi:hypothetical protein
VSVHPLAGRWLYRSFRSRTDDVTKLEDLLFWQAEIVLLEGPMETLSGTIGDRTDTLVLRGSASYGAPYTVRFQGAGVEGTDTAGWIYDYVGYLIPPWPHGVAQVPSIVGSVIRTVPHSEGRAKAGVVAQFVALKLG